VWNEDERRTGDGRRLGVKKVAVAQAEFGRALCFGGDPVGFSGKVNAAHGVKPIELALVALVTTKLISRIFRAN
jgi:hypothetical protein